MIREDVGTMWDYLEHEVRPEGTPVSDDVEEVRPWRGFRLTYSREERVTLHICHASDREPGPGGYDKPISFRLSRDIWREP